jgi:hypothetical protein
MPNTTAKVLNWLTPDSKKGSDKQYFGIGEFTTFVEVDSTVNFNATAPDVVCEDLTTAQDSIINRPKSYTINGEVADIFIETVVDPGIGTTLSKVLNSATPYLPQRTLSQIQKIEDQANNIENQLTQIGNAIDGGIAVLGGLGFFGSSPGANRTIKEQFFDHIERIYDSRQPITVDLQYRTLENVVIESFSYLEDNVGDPGSFQIVIKQLRIVSIDLFRDNQNLSDAEKAKKKENPTVDGQLDSPVDKGLNQGTTVSAVPASFLLGAI